MKNALAVARLELREWRALPIVALALGLVPLGGWLAGLELDEANSLRAALSRTAGTLLLLWIGGVVFTCELRQPSGTFWLARPVSRLALWSGQWLAASGLALLAGVCLGAPSWPILVLPKLLAGTPLLAPQAEVLKVARLLFCLGLGHWGALAIRSRSLRVLVDMVVTLTLLFIAGREIVMLVDSGSVPFLDGLEILTAGLVGVCAFGLTLAGAVRLQRGALALRPAYAVFALTNWLVLGTAVGALAAYRHWLASPTTRALDKLAIGSVSPDGAWVDVQGQRHEGAFGYVSLLARTDGTGAIWCAGGLGYPVAYSADGRRAAWAQIGLGLRVKVTRLHADARPLVLMTLRAKPLDARLSPEGGTLLVLGLQGGAEVWPTDQPHDFVADIVEEDGGAPAPLWRDDAVEDAGFLDEHTLWVLRAGDDARSLERVDLSSGHGTPWCRLTVPPKSRLVLSPDARRALVWSWEGGQQSLRVCDLSDGACRELSLDGLPAKDGMGASAAFLSDGSIAIASGVRNRGQRSVRVLEPDGQARWRLGGGYWSTLLGEPRDGLLAVAVRDTLVGGRLEVAFIDIVTGRVLRREAGLLGQIVADWNSPFLRGPAATLFMEDWRRLVRLDLDTWQRRPVPLP